jgi:SET domain-containing protein
MITLSSAVPAIADLYEDYEINEHPEPNSNIEMEYDDGYKGLFARRDIFAGSVIFHMKGRVSRRPNKYSIQLSWDKHLDFPTVRKPNDDLDYAWQYLNHSCEPNSYVNATEYCFCALRNIRKGEEITFNYLTTEYELATPFPCGCGSVKCYGFIGGYKFLTADQIAGLLPVTAKTQKGTKSPKDSRESFGLYVPFYG